MRHIPIIALILSAPLCGFGAPATDAAPVVIATPTIVPAELALGEAHATYKDGVLKVETGAVGRTWSWTGFGLSTTSFSDPATNIDYATTGGKPQVCDWDGILHANPTGREKGLAVFYNPLNEDITRDIRIPLHYTGLVGRAMVSVDGESTKAAILDSGGDTLLAVKIPAHGRTFLLFTE